MSTNLQIVSNRTAFQAIATEPVVEKSEVERHARHVELRDKCARQSEFEIFCFDILKHVEPEKREAYPLPTFRMWEMFHRKGAHHA